MTRRQHPVSEKEHTHRIESMQTALKSESVRIPISQVVDILYKQTGTHLHVLVASPTFTGQKEGNLVYVEGGSQHGMLRLFYIPSKLAAELHHRVNVDGNYDRQHLGRENIIAIYLKTKDVIPASYHGTLDDLMQNPNIARRPRED